jgi:hypothetical protein
LVARALDNDRPADRHVELREQDHRLDSGVSRSFMNSLS